MDGEEDFALRREVLRTTSTSSESNISYNVLSPRSRSSVSSISHNISVPSPEEDVKYVSIKFFPTGDAQDGESESSDSDNSQTPRANGQPSPPPTGDYTITRSYQSPDGDKRTIVTSTKRSVIVSSSGSDDVEQPLKVSDVTARQDDVFMQETLDRMSRLSSGKAPTVDEAREVVTQMTRERLSRAAASVGDDETLVNMQRLKQDINTARPTPDRTSITPSPDLERSSRTSSTSSGQSWMTRDNLRTSFDSGISSTPSTHQTELSQDRKKPPTPDPTLTFALGSMSRFAASSLKDQKPAVERPETYTRRGPDNLERFLLMYEPKPIPAAACRIRAIVPRDSGWDNHAHQILQAELGEEALIKRLEKQNKIFEAGAKKGNIFENIPMWFKNWKIKSMFEKKAREEKKAGLKTGHVGALGYAVILKNSAIPDNDFFVPKRMFEVRAKHSSFPTYSDDNRAAWRSLSLKFQDHDFDSPLDLVLHSGRTSPFFNVESMEDFYTAQAKGGAALKEYLSSLPIYLESVIEGVRQGIGSYNSVHYYAHATYDFKAKDGRRRVARFRVVPADGPGDRGRLKTQEQRDLWFKMLLKPEEDELERKFLKTEWRRRVEESSVTYCLQIQLYECQVGDTYALYNPAIAWDEGKTHWQDLARIRLLTVMPDDVVTMTGFNVGNVPADCLGFPEPTSTTDFNVVPYIHKEIYQACSKVVYHDPPVLSADEGVEYLIHIVTGGQEKAGINVDLGKKCDTYICLIGTSGRTPFIRLDRRNKNDFSRSSRSTFTLRQKYIGDVQCVKIYKDKRGSKSDWFLDFVVISTTYNGSCYSLPCYRWFNDTTPLHVLRDGTPTLFDKESSYYIKRQRQAEVTLRQQTFRWHVHGDGTPYDGLPGFCDAGDDIDKLPSDLRSENAHKLLQEWDKHLDGKNSLFKKIKGVIRPRWTKGKTVDEACEKDLADQLPNTKDYHMLQYTIRNWRSDAEFSRQILNGVMPQKLVQLREIPQTFPLTQDMVKGLLPIRTSLDKELEAGNLYMISYSELQEFVRRPVDDDDSDEVAMDTTADTSQSALTDAKKQENNNKKKKEDSDTEKYLCAPMVLFYMTDDKTLSPLAIQLTQKSASQPLIYTPLDNEGDFSAWQMAKLWVRVAEANVHQFAGRILGTHLILEPVAMAMMRNLPAVHPVFKLIYPYLEDLVTVNTIYRKYVLSKEGALAEVMAIGKQGMNLIKRQVSKFSKFSALNLPENFANRGVLDPNQLPGYYYRDDSLMLWEAIRDFVIDIVCVYYDDDEQVAADNELIVMLKDLHKNGYNGKLELAKKFTTIEELVQFCTTIIFRATVQYSASSRGMADVYSFCLNCPPCLMKPPPTAKVTSGYESDYVHSLLPPSELQERYINMVLLMLQGFKKPKMTLGHYPSQVFTDEKAIIAIKSFQKQLKEISEHIVKRKSKLEEWNYEYLLPNNIPAGITA